MRSRLVCTSLVFLPYTTPAPLFVDGIQVVCQDGAWMIYSYFSDVLSVYWHLSKSSTFKKKAFVKTFEDTYSTVVREDDVLSSPIRVPMKKLSPSLTAMEDCQVPVQAFLQAILKENRIRAGDLNNGITSCFCLSCLCSPSCCGH